MKPLAFQWNGIAMVPSPRSQAMAEKQFVDGQFYNMVVEESRSANTHRHQFAEIHDAWLNLPEHWAAHFPTSEHLRKYALIKAGFCDVEDYPHGKPRRLAIDTYSIVVVGEHATTVYRAKSQSRKAMGAKDFQASKQAVLDIISAMIEVTPETLQQNAGRAA
jgi:hypothetical protein